MAFTTLQNATSTSTGTGTTKTQVNGGNDLIIPAGVRFIYDAIPYQAATAAYTAAEGSAQQIALESVDIQPNISPKIINMCETNGGLGTFAGTVVGLLQTFPINVPCLGGNRLKVYGTSLVLNTAAFRVGCGFLESDSGSGEQLYWDATGRTSTGTTAARVAGSDITISAGKRLKKVYQHLYVGGTVTASESLTGYGEFVSNGFVDAIPLTFPIQPTGAGLGTAVQMMKVGELTYNVDIGLRNPGTGQVTINTFCNVEEANTAAQSFNSGLAYTR